MTESFSFRFRCLIILLSIFLVEDTWAQSTFQITGSVKDSKENSPLPFANVFINNSTMGTTTNEDGVFHFAIKQPGKYRLVISYVGYEIYEREIEIPLSDQDNLPMAIETIFLKPAQKFLDEVQVNAKRDKDWERNIETFKEIFLGNKVSRKQTTIANPGSIDLIKEKGKLIATTDEPIIIENTYLGYRVIYFLKKFWSDKEGFLMEGYAKFEELSGVSNSQKVIWVENREKAYRGSFQHFLYSCVTKKLSEEGYKIYIDSADVNLPIHSVGRNLFAEYEKSLVRAEPLLKISTKDSVEYSVNFQNRLEIHYLNQRTKRRYYPDVTHQVSRLMANDHQIECLYNGMPLGVDWALWGNMTERRISDLLPVDYTQQNRIRIPVTGTIVDSKTGAGVEGANVFLNKSSIGNFTSRDGSFALADIPNGFFDLIVVKQGYELFSSKINIENAKSYALKLKISPVGYKKRGTKGFKKKVPINILNYVHSKFTIQQADSFQWVNPEVMRFVKKSEDTFISTEKPLQFENSLTGYKVLFYMLPHQINTDSGLQGYFWFNPLSPVSHQQYTQFEHYRKKHYNGSQKHFLAALFANKLSNEGFCLRDNMGKDRTPSVIDVRSMPGYRSINLNQAKTISFYPAQQVTDFYDRLLLEKSSIVKYDSNILVNEQGVLLNGNSILFSGTLAAQHFPKMLPIDFNVPFQNTMFDEISKYRETVTIHTSKEYYQELEPIYVKASMHYSTPSLTDSLSRVLYVELIDQRKQVLQTKRLKIDDGVAFGAFLPDQNIAPGRFRIRAYTSWMQNFDLKYFEKYIEILPRNMNYSLRPDLTEGCQLTKGANLQVAIDPNKKIYRPREKIKLTVSIADSVGKPVKSYFSVSVVDANVVFERSNISSVNSSMKSFLDTIVYPIERAIGVKARMKNSKGKKSRVQFINLENQLFFETDVSEEGSLFLALPDFTDSINFNVTGTNVKTTFLPEIEVDKWFAPQVTDLIDLPVDHSGGARASLVFDNRVALSNQHLFDEKATLLQEVVIKSTKIIITKASKTSLIKPEYSIKADDIKSMGSNLLIGLAGKIPGVEIKCNGINCNVSFTRASGGSILLGGEPLVLLNGIPLYGQSAGEIFTHIDPSMIEKIEIQKSSNVLYGSEGRNGIIALTTKTGLDEKNYQRENNSRLTLLTIPGFSENISFPQPDYERNSTTLVDITDYRSTLYWEPSVKADGVRNQVPITFFAADNPTTYRIKIEGHTNSGNYFVATKCIQVKE